MAFPTQHNDAMLWEILEPKPKGTNQVFYQCDDDLLSQSNINYTQST